MGAYSCLNRCIFVYTYLSVYGAMYVYISVDTHVGTPYRVLTYSNKACDYIGKKG